MGQTNKRIESDSSAKCVIIKSGINILLPLPLIIIFINLVGYTNSQLLSEFQSSKEPVTDIFSLAQLLKRSNENPGSQMTTVRKTRTICVYIRICFIV